MRTINEIIIHCSGTPISKEVSADDINHYHKSKGWDCIGYHYYIRRNGAIEPGRPIAKVGAHCYGHNRNTIGVCYEGGLTYVGNTPQEVDTRTPEQVRSLYLLLTTLLHAFPTIQKISGHRDYFNKACPCFDAAAEYGQLVAYVRGLDWEGVVY